MASTNATGITSLGFASDADAVATLLTAAGGGTNPLGVLDGDEDGSAGTGPLGVWAIKE